MAGASAPASPGSPADFSRHRVLLVEDQPDVARATCMGLEHLGAAVCIAPTGLVAVELAEAFRPSLVLLDIDLPDIDGHEVARRLRLMPLLSDVPFVALTSWNTPDMRQRSAEAGLAEHLAKPLDLNGLTELLTRTKPPT